MLLQSPAPPIWNSLEIIKLVVSALAPLFVAYFGWRLSQRLKRVELWQWTNQKLIEKRLAIYSDLAPVLNDIYCYFDYIGSSVTLSPAEAIELKRKADRLFFVNAPLFSESYQREYRAFLYLCFKPGDELDLDRSARLKTDIEIRRKHWPGVEWKQEWKNLFVAKEEVSERDTIHEAYWRMMNSFARELGAGLQDPAEGVSSLLNHDVHI